MKNINKSKIKSIGSQPNIESMSLYELCRWAALKDAVDIIGDKCEEKKIDFTSFELKPLDLLKYVDVATDTLYNKIVNEQEQV